MMSKLKYLGLALLVATVGLSAHAAVVTKTQLQIQSNIQHEINPALKAWDSNAFAVVQVKMKVEDKDQALPGTPFVAQGLDLQAEGNDEVKLAQMRVDVYSTKNPLPRSMTELVKAIGNTYGVEPEIKVLAIATDELESNNSKVTEQKRAEELRLIYWIALGAFGLFMLVIAICFGVLSRSIRKASEKMAVKSEPEFDRPERAAGATQPIAASAAVTKSDQGLDLTDEGLAALITDCYWSENDQYAGFLVRKMSLKQKTYLMKEFPWLDHYLKTVMDVTPADLGLESDLAYLNPLPIFAVSSAELTRVVQQNPALMNRLSSLRMQSLMFSAIEKIKFLNQPTEAIGEKVLRDLFVGRQSNRRILRQNYSVIKFVSVEEEAEVLASEQITLDQLMGLPTLGLAQKLPQETVEKILRGFSSRELASAWVGPDFVLDLLKQAMPEKKYQNLASFLENSKPSRTSPVFISLQQKFVEALQKNSTETNHAEAA